MSRASQLKTIQAARRSDNGLVRVRAEDARQRQAEVDGTRYNFRGGYAYMHPAHAKAHNEAANVPMPAAAGPVGRGAGYRCTSCGFGSFFTTCGRVVDGVRCGGHCVREGETTHAPQEQDE